MKPSDYPYAEIYSKSGDCSRSHAPAGSPSPGFEFFEGGLKKTVTSVWLSRFDTWKVSWRDNKGGGGITNLEYFMENTEVSHGVRNERN